MKVNFKQTIDSLKGESMKVQNPDYVGSDGKVKDGASMLIDLTYEDVIINSLLAQATDAQGKPETLPAKESIERSVLAEEVFKAKKIVEITTEQASKIKELVAKNYNTWVVYKVDQLLEGK